jgi:phosphotransferase system enzyme I (PtsP)
MTGDPLDESGAHVRVHERGADRAIDGVLTLIEEAYSDAPLPEVLRTLCEEVSGIVHAPVVSAYLREEDEGGHVVLVMRANVGFAPDAVGRVRLGLGEGITGFVAQRLRPVSVAAAETESHFKAIPGLGEERFPCFAAVPILVGGACGGVLVLQREASRPFDVREVALATAMATFFAHAIERARARDRGALDARTTGSARLLGAPVAPGVALGRAEPVLGWAALEEGLAPEAAAALASPAGREDAVRKAFAAVARDVQKVTQRLEGALGPESTAELLGLGLALEDRRLVDEAAHAARDAGLGAGLRKIARAYAFAPYKTAGGAAPESWVADRAADLEDLCLLAGASAAGKRVPGPGAVVLLHERLGAFAALLSVAHRSAAVVVGGPVPHEALGARVARAAGLPVVADVAGLFAWTRLHDPVLVDGDAGLVRVQPTQTEIARARSARPPPG